MVEKKINISKLLSIMDTDNQYAKSIAAVEIVVGKIKWPKIEEEKEDTQIQDQPVKKPLQLPPDFVLPKSLPVTEKALNEEEEKIVENPTNDDSFESIEETKVLRNDPNDLSD